MQSTGPVQGVVIGGNIPSSSRSSSLVGLGAITSVVGAGVGSDREMVDDGSAEAIDDNPDVDSSSSIEEDMALVTARNCSN